MPIQLLLIFTLALGCGDDGGGADVGADSMVGDSAADSSGDAGPGDAGDSGGGRIDSCEGPGDCQLSYNAGCCATCERAVASDYDAINSMHSDEHRLMSCPDWPVGCEPCATPPPPNPGLVAGCDLPTSTCTRLDFEAEEWTTCTEDTECALVVPECCNCDALTPDQIVAVRADRQTDMYGYLCDPRADCPPCVPTYPPEASAACTGGRCTVVVD